MRRSDLAEILNDNYLLNRQAGACSELRCQVSVRPNIEMPTYPRTFKESPSTASSALYILPESGSYNLPFFAWVPSVSAKSCPSSMPQSGRLRSETSVVLVIEGSMINRPN